jgi:hypothetical protein
MTDEPTTAPQTPSAALPGLERRYLLPRDDEAAAALLGGVARWQQPGSLSITQVAKVLNPGEGLLYWANKVGLEGKTLDEARNNPRSSGTKAHTAFTASADERPDGCGGILKWFEETHPQLLATERWVATTDDPLVHGKGDYIRRSVDEHGRPAVIVGDAKPLGSGKTWFEQHVQVAGYAYVLSSWGVRVAGTEILLYDDADFHPVAGIVSGDLFRSLARLAHTIERLKAQL